MEKMVNKAQIVNLFTWMCVKFNSRYTQILRKKYLLSGFRNVLGKRIRKPNIVAELNDELKQTRKQRKNEKKPNPIQPVHESNITTESECEASDFSDLD